MCLFNQFGFVYIHFFTNGNLIKVLFIVSKSVGLQMSQAGGLEKKGGSGFAVCSYLLSQRILTL